MTGAIRRLLARDRRFGLVVRARASAAEIALAEQVVDRSGIAFKLEALLEDARPAGAGRPRQLPVRTLLVALLTLATAGQPLHLRRAVELLTNLPAATQPSGDILADRWYTQQRAGRFTLPLRRAGAGLVFDYKADQAGPDGSYRGALKVDGRLYCPSMPARLHHLPDAHYKNRDQLDAREQLEAKRGPWRMLPLAAEDDDGFQRMQCPAQRGKVRCPLKRASLTRPMADVPTVLDPPAAPDACCTQKTFKVPPSVNAGTRQKHPWGSTAWRTSYNRRNVVEGAAGVLKTAGGTDVKRDHIRVMGLTAHTLLMAFAVAGTNLGLHARHLERTDAGAVSHDGDVVELEDTFTPGGYDQLIATTAAKVAGERQRQRQGADPPAA